MMSHENNPRSSQFIEAMIFIGLLLAIHFIAYVVARSSMELISRGYLVFIGLVLPIVSLVGCMILHSTRRWHGGQVVFVSLLVVLMSLIQYVSLFMRVRAGPLLVAQSEVPVLPLAFGWETRKIEFTVQNIKAVVREPLQNYSNRKKFILQCRIHGEAKSEVGCRPVIVAVESSYTCVQRGDFGTPSTADVVLRPRLSTTHDPSYLGELIELETTIEEVVSAMSRGENHYNVPSGSAISTVGVFYDKAVSGVLPPEN
jgi:hypothetical protein